MFFRFFFSLLLFLPFSSYGFLENSSCIKDIGRYAPLLFRGGINAKQQERFFSCLHDALELMQEHVVPSEDGSRDYYIEDDFFKLFHFLFKQPEKTSRDIARQIFAMKKIALGGSPDRYTIKEIQHTINLMFDFETFFYLIRKDISYYHEVFFTPKGFFIQPKQLDQSLKQLERAFKILSQAFKREGISYDLSSLDKYYIYFDRVGFPMKKEQYENWKQFSLFLKIWAEGVFNSNGETLIEGEKWDYFLPAMHKLFSQFAYYKIYLAGKDMLQPDTLQMTLKSLSFFISSIEYVKYNKAQPGFPIKKLDNLLKIFISQLGDANPDISPTLSFLREQEGLPLFLFTRSLVCFSLQSESNKSCSLKWIEDPSSSETVQAHFPDGVFKLHIDRQEWIPNNNSFYLSINQIQDLQQWLHRWSDGIQQILLGEGEVVAKERGFSHWLGGAFSQDKEGRFEFSRLLPSFSPEKIYTLTRYEAFIDLILSSHLRNSEQISRENWNSIVNQLSPALIALNSLGYEKEWKNRFIDLFDYGDFFLNSSDRNSSLSRSEIIDITTHILSAQRSGKLAFQTLKLRCDSNHSSCASKNLFFERKLLDNFKGLQNELSFKNPKNYIKNTENLLPETLNSSFDFVPFFMLIQMMEVNFYFYDKDKSNFLEMDEFIAFSKNIEPHLVKKVPYIHNVKQARAFLVYSAKKEVIPFVTEGDKQFSSTEFINWYLYPSKWNTSVFSREELLYLSFNFYHVYSSLGSRDVF